MSKYIAVIPARGGSKRIPLKNIRNFLGKPIIAYTIQVARSSGLFDEIMVSTDNNEIAKVAKDYGATVPFMRSERNSDDFTGPGDVVYEVLQEYEKEGREFEMGCCLLPTAPLMTVESLQSGYKLINESEFEVVFPIAKFDYPIWRSLRMEVDGTVRMNFPEFEKSRSQDLEEAYHDAGQFYWFKKSSFYELSNKNLFGNVKGSIKVDSMLIQDIDTEEDWNLAEFKARYLGN